MSRRWYDVNHPIAQIQLGNALPPMIEPKKARTDAKSAGTTSTFGSEANRRRQQ